MENEVKLGSRAIVFKEGSQASKLYLVRTGEILCLKASKDRLIPVFLAKRGDIIGESAMLDNSLHTYSAIALTYAELVEVPSSNFKEVFAMSPEWLVELTQTMITRFQNTSTLIAENRLIHPSIISEEQFSSMIEVEFKKILS
jgi:CRP-like cAMP-binding protein